MKKVLGFALLTVLAMGVGCSANTTFDVQNDSTMEADAGSERMMEGGTASDTGTMVDADVPGAMVDTTVAADVDAMMSDVKVFTVEGGNFVFTPNSIQVKKGDTVRIIFKNVEGFHDFKIDEFNVATKQIAANATETVEFVADEVGSFEYYCTVGKHREMGMVGTLVVTE